MNAPIVNAPRLAVALLMLPVLMALDCGDKLNECINPTARTVCTGVCRKRLPCENCCEKHPGQWPGGAEFDKQACLDACEAVPVSLMLPDIAEDDCCGDSAHEAPYEFEHPPYQICPDAAYDAILDLVPAFMATEEFREALCAMAPEERIEALSDVEANLDDIWAVSEDDFNDEVLPWIDQLVRDLMESQGASGDDAYRFYYNHVMRMLWYELVVA